jgi:hypothetical protein
MGGHAARRLTNSSESAAVPAADLFCSLLNVGAKPTAPPPDGRPGRRIAACFIAVSAHRQLLAEDETAKLAEGLVYGGDGPRG